MTMTVKDWEEWYQHPVTQAHLQNLRESRQETMEAWADEAYVGETGERTLQSNAKALGGLQLLSHVIQSIESYKPEEKGQE